MTTARGTEVATTTGLTIDRSAPVPLHFQIAEVIRERVTLGIWPAHYRLKPEPELAAEFGVSRGTLRKALGALIAEGRLVQVRGRGTFVTAEQVEPALAQDLTTLSEDFAARGITSDVTVLGSELNRAPGTVAGLLDIDPTDPVLVLRRIRSTPEGPVAYLVNFVRADLAPGIEATDFSSASLFGTLEDDFGKAVTTARRTFIAQAADAEVADALQLPTGAPVQYLQQVSYLAGGRAIEYSDVWINSDRMRVTSMLSRRPSPHS
ncbi:GntR family transcriptional regulator [Brevibacterium marinum]|uniref:DNA-binding GntR family transcriptional regulator n=1 Tax=Brevibacterium marinum TaxID=418643 RepID=A0A846RRR2_9MICO|nr:GntR family transcriptional regulator [Brevibacterium marinum]NJC56449.1 DNA-binding GntR family transcriptional regulator [Brevibacterium marinum]